MKVSVELLREVNTQVFMHQTVLALFLRCDGNNIVLPDTNCDLGFTQEELAHWIRYFYGIGEVDETIINHTTSRCITCAQYCVRNQSQAQEEYDKHQTNTHDSIQLLGVHRESGERRARSVDVITNNNVQFSDWCRQYANALILDLTNLESQRSFREIMELEPIEPPVHVDPSIVRKMFSQLITDFQAIYKFGLAPMNGNAMILGVVYAMKCASPDILNTDGVHIGSLCPEDLGITSPLDIEQVYQAMLYPSNSNMNFYVSVELYPLTTTSDVIAEEAVASLRFLSITNMKQITRGGPTQRHVSVFESLERCLRDVASILNDNESNDSNPNLDDTSLLENTRWEILADMAYATYLSEPTVMSLRVFLASLYKTHKVSMCRVTIENLINKNIGDIFHKKKILDPREWNILAVAPMLYHVMYRSLYPGENDIWGQPQMTDIAGLINNFCGTTTATTIQSDHFRGPNPMLGINRMGVLGILYLWEASVCFDIQSELISSLTKTDDSITSMQPSQRPTNEDKIRIIGET